MRKGPGLSALSRHTTTSTSYASLSTQISTNQIQSLESSLNSFKETLITFAKSHREDILRDPAFRHQFTKMCSVLGVDPLIGSSSTSSSSSSNNKLKFGGSGSGIWEKLGLGEWSYELCVQLVDVCISTRGLNGGLIELSELVKRIEKMRSGGIGIKQDRNNIQHQTSISTSISTSSIDKEDIKRAIQLLSPLAGYHIITIPNSTTTYIRSIPRELDLDTTTLLSLAKDIGGGPLTESSVSKKLNWNSMRTRAGLEALVMREGIGWVDSQFDQDDHSTLNQVTGIDLGFVGEGIGGSVWVIAAVDFGEK